MWIKKAVIVWLLLGVSAPGWGGSCVDQPPRMEKKRFVAIGYGAAIGDTEGQRQLMAIRAGKMDAYRAMAERIHGFRISGSTTVSTMMVKSDNFRVYVDAQLRGAKLVSVQPMTEDTYEVTMELELNLPVPGSEKRCEEVVEEQSIQTSETMTPQEGTDPVVENVTEERTEVQAVQRGSDNKPSYGEQVYQENFLTKLVHAITEPILSPQHNAEADLDQYETVPPADRIIYQRGVTQ